MTAANDRPSEARARARSKTSYKFLVVGNTAGQVTSRFPTCVTTLPGPGHGGCSVRHPRPSVCRIPRRSVQGRAGRVHGPTLVSSDRPPSGPDGRGSRVLSGDADSTAGGLVVRAAYSMIGSRFDALHAALVEVNDHLAGAGEPDAEAFEDLVGESL